jgi:hypothetical protein
MHDSMMCIADVLVKILIDRKLSKISIGVFINHQILGTQHD